ncbi:MAG: sigma-70 family RNA polymerase sigma factor [Oscillospiraceae bacterium]|nr:sigma-70 family RNA polymerase sigma factor [Oscillospiraceae bacterium]
MALNVNESLTNTAAKGQGAPLAKLVASFLPYIEQKISTLSIPGQDRDDLRQEAFVALFSAIESYEDGRGAEFSTYAIACINNRLADAARAASRLKNKPLNESVSLSDEAHPIQLASSLSLEDMAIVKEEYRTVQSRIQALLSALERETLSLWLAGYDYGEIARRLGTTPKSVGNALQRARRKLKQE